MENGGKTADLAFGHVVFFPLLGDLEKILSPSGLEDSIGYEWASPRLCKDKELWRWVVVVRNDVHELNTDLLK